MTAARRVHDPEVTAARYLSGDMPQRARRWFEAHLLGCEDCWREVVLGRRGRAAGERARELAPAGLRDRVRAGVALAAAERGGGTRARRWLLAAVAALALVLRATVCRGSGPRP